MIPIFVHVPFVILCALAGAALAGHGALVKKLFSPPVASARSAPVMRVHYCRPSDTDSRCRNAHRTPREGPEPTAAER